MPTLNPYRVRVPADVRTKARCMKLSVPIGNARVDLTVRPAGDFIKFALSARDPSETKRQKAQINAHLEGVWQALRRGAVVIDWRTAQRFAGDFYARVTREDAKVTAGRDFDRVAVNGTLCREVKSGPLEPGLSAPDVEMLEGAIERMRSPSLDLEAQVGPLVDKCLLDHGYREADPDGRTYLLTAFRDAVLKVLLLRQRQDGGDFTPDETLKSFGHIGDLSNLAGPPSGVSLRGLVDSWWKEAKKAGRTLSTYDSYSGTFKRLADFLKHDDAAAVLPDDVVRYKEHRLASGISPKTVADSDIAGLKAVFGWAVDNRKLPSNPASGITVVRERKAKLRGKDFSAEEALAILRRAMGENGDSMRARVRRWVPWLCAYTGARVGEIIQLRKQDLREEESGVYVLTISPEAGTVKDKELREVVLHQHLVDMGFVDFVARLPGPYVFIVPTGEVHKAVKTAKTRLAEFARGIVTDPSVAPNHGWRHTFKTIGREVGIADTVLDGICGHVSQTQGGRYGSVSVSAQVEAMKRYPKYPT